MVWLAYIQITGERRLRHGHNGNEYRLPELQRYSVVGYCEQTKTACACGLFLVRSHMSLVQG